MKTIVSNKSGFTLIELTAIILILATILLVTFPTLESTKRKDEENKFKDLEKVLCESGKEYLYNNISEYPDIAVPNSVIQIPIVLLIEYGNVDDSLINPKTNESIFSDKLTFTVNTDNTLSCIYSE